VDVFDAIKKRRSIRSYRSDSIPDEVLDKLLKALRLAPSGGNLQPYKFIVVRDKETKATLAVACNWNPGRPKGQDFIAEAPVVIVACSSKEKALSRYYKDGKVFLAIERDIPAEADRSTAGYLNLVDIDLAIAMDHLALAAVEEGLGTCWIAALDEQEVKKVVSVPEDMRVQVVMPLGYTDSWPEPRPRKPLEELICYDRYS
jgi:nitroreductase